MWTEKHAQKYKELSETAASMRPAFLEMAKVMPEGPRRTVLEASVRYSFEIKDGELQVTDSVDGSFIALTFTEAVAICAAVGAVDNAITKEAA